LAVAKASAEAVGLPLVAERHLTGNSGRR